MNRIDIFAGLAYLSSGVLATLAITLGDAMPGYAKQIVAVAAVITVISGLLLRMRKNPSPPSGTTPVLQEKAPQ